MEDSSSGVVTAEEICDPVTPSDMSDVGVVVGVFDPFGGFANCDVALFYVSRRAYVGGRASGKGDSGPIPSKTWDSRGARCDKFSRQIILDVTAD